MRPEKSAGQTGIAAVTLARFGDRSNRMATA